MERLTVEDQVMLWGDEIWPQEIGAVAILEGDRLLAPDGRFRIEVVQQMIEARLHLVPRFRQLLHVPRRGLGGPLWVDDPAFDLNQHVCVVPLPAPGTEAQLLQTIEQLRRSRMDRSRPLWQMCFLPGLPGRRVGLFVRMHHIIADGVAGVATVGVFLDATPDVPAPAAPPPWVPAPPPTARDLVADNLRRVVHRVARAGLTLARPTTTLRRLVPAWSAMRDLRHAAPAPDTTLNRVVGADRRLALVRGSLAEIRQIAHAHHATVNDVLLAATAGGLRALLRSRGEPVDDLIVRIDVPVTLRPAAVRAQARGNLIGLIIVPLPVGLADTHRRLARIAAETASRKARPQPSVGTVLHSRVARRALAKILARRPVNVASADLPGPPEPVYLAGARLLEVFPLLPLIANVSLGVGALSYAGQFTVMAVADRDAHPDLDVFADAMANELRALAASTTTLCRARSDPDEGRTSAGTGACDPVGRPPAR